MHFISLKSFMKSSMITSSHNILSSMFYSLFFQCYQVLTAKASWQGAYLQGQKKSQVFFLQPHHPSPLLVSWIKKWFKDLQKLVATDNALFNS